MPPIGFWGATHATFTGAAFSLFTPRLAEDGNVLYAILAFAGASLAAPAGWEEIETFEGDALTIAVFRHPVGRVEPGVHIFPAPGEINGVGVVMLYRGAHDVLPAVDSAGVSFVPTTAPGALPVTTTSKTDAVLWISVVEGENTFTGSDTAPVRIVATSSGTGAASMAVVESRPELVGSVGPIGFFWEDSAAAVSLSLVIPASVVVQAQAFEYTIPGAIGLVTEGV